MQRLLAFSVYDSKAEAYLRPFFAETRGLALRSFRDAANDPTAEMCVHAADYTLFEVGSFDQVKGEFTPSVPVTLGNALTFKEKVS